MTALPQGPRSALLQTYHYARDPNDYYARLAARFGDTFTTPTLNGPVVVSRCPQVIKALFTAEPQTLGIFGGPSLRPIFGEHALIMQEGEAHKRSRRLISPLFSAARARSYAPMMSEVVAQELAGWPRDVRFPLLPALQSLSLRIILRTVFGVAAGAAPRGLHQTLIELVGATRPSLLFFPGLRRDYLGLSPWRRFRTLREEVRKQVGALIATRQRGGLPGEHILGLLCEACDADGSAFSEEAMIEQLLTMVYAGYETSAAATAWALYLLAREPAARSRLLDELLNSNLQAWLENDYLEALCSETLRLYPVIPDIDRLLRTKLAIPGYTLPCGLAVAVPITLVHKDPRIYSQPEGFRPERFAARPPSPFEYLPFGGGARRCIGAAYALCQMKIIIAQVFSRFRIELAERRDVPAVRRSLLMVPRGGVHVRLHTPARSPFSRCSKGVADEASPGP